jgi:signal transduction histidine kinase
MEEVLLGGSSLDQPLSDHSSTREQALLEEIARLTEAKAATDQALERLANHTTPDGFVRNVQRAMIDVLGGRCSAQFKVSGSVLLGGVIFADGQFISDHTLVGIRDSDIPSWNGILSNPRPTVFTYPDNLELMDEYTARFMQARGFRWLVNFPLFIAGTPAWILAVLGDNPERLTAANLDHFSALSRQLTLALQLNHMHDEARRNERARAIAEERTSVARDIHDTLAQGFAAICMRLQAAQREPQFNETPEAVRHQIRAALEVSALHVLHARQSIHRLREGTEHFHLDEALQVAIRQIGIDIPLSSALQFPATPVPNAVGVELLRIVQEALTNAAKHSAASRISLQVSPAEDGILIAIADNGKGFDQDAPREGFGLNGMQERANRIGARLTIASERGAGTEIIVAWNPELPGAVA